MYVDTFFPVSAKNAGMAENGGQSAFDAMYQVSFFDTIHRRSILGCIEVQGSGKYQISIFRYIKNMAIYCFSIWYVEVRYYDIRGIELWYSDLPGYCFSIQYIAVWYYGMPGIEIRYSDTIDISKTSIRYSTLLIEYIATLVSARKSFPVNPSRPFPFRVRRSLQLVSMWIWAGTPPSSPPSRRRSTATL